MKIDLTEREFLWELERAIVAQMIEGRSPHWKRTYEDLLHSVNVLDAHLARCSINQGAAGTMNNLKIGD